MNKDALRRWAEKVIKEQGADAPGHATEITLTSEGARWQTWAVSGLVLDDFVADADIVCDGIADECPIKRVALMFSAEDATGGVRTQHPTSVQGKNKNADALAGSGSNTAKSFAEAMEGMCRVMVAVAKSQEIQVNSLTKTLESQATQIHEMIEYQRAKQELELTEKQGDSEISQTVIAQVKEILPMLPVALELWQKEKATDLAARAAKVVINATTNGASS